MTGASLNEAAPNLLFLTARISGEHYMTCLAFTDREFCRRLHVFLQAHIGKSIKEIGDLDLPRTL